MKKKVKKVATKPFNNAEMRGVDRVDILCIHAALQRGETLSIDKFGHIYNNYGRWIADGMRRETN